MKGGEGERLGKCYSVADVARRPGGSSIHLCLSMDKKFDSVVHPCLLGLMLSQSGRCSITMCELCTNESVFIFKELRGKAFVWAPSIFKLLT